jgi:hypothetical protein
VIDNQPRVFFSGEIAPRRSLVATLAPFAGYNTYAAKDRKAKTWTSDVQRRGFTPAILLLRRSRCEA